MSNTFSKNPIAKKFLESSVWNQLGKSFQFLMNFLLTVIISRQLGKTLYGEYSWFISFCMFFGLFTQLGFENMLNIFIPKLADSQARISFLVKRLVSVRVFIIFVVCLLLFFLLPWIDIWFPFVNFSRFMGYAIGYIFFSNLASLLSRILVSYHRLKYLSLINMVVSALQLISVYFFLFMGYGLGTILLIITLSAIVSCISYLVTLRKLFFLTSQPFDLRPLTSLGLTSWMTALVEFGLGKQIDILLISFFISSIAEAGLYNIGITTPTMISALMTAGLGGVVLTAFSEIEKKHQNEQLGAAWQSMIKLQFLLSAPILAFVIMFARPIILSLYTETYQSAAVMTQVFGYFLLAQRILGGGTHITVMYAKQKAKAVLITRLAGGIFNFLLDIILIPIYGAVGAIVATGFCLMLTVALEYIYIHKILQPNYPIIFILKVSAAIIISLSLLRFINVQNVFSLVGAGAVYMFCLVSALYFVKPFSYTDRQDIILSNIAASKYLRFFCT